MKRRDAGKNFDFPACITDAMLAPLAAAEAELGKTISLYSGPYRRTKPSIISVSVGYAYQDSVDPTHRQDRQTVRMSQMFHVSLAAGYRMTLAPKTANSVGLSYTTHDGQQYTLAERVGGRLYILWNIFEVGNIVDALTDKTDLVAAYTVLVTTTFTWVAEQLLQGDDPAELDATMAQISTLMSEIARGQYGNHIRNLFELQTRITEMSAELAALIAQNERSVSIRARYEDIKQDLESKLASQVRSITHYPAVSHIMVENSTLHVYTDEITFYDDENDIHYWLGRYRISIDMRVGQMAVHIFNLDRTPNNLHHPHMRDVICWGGFSDMVTSAIANGNYDTAVVVILQWLSAINIHDGWGSAIEHFPHVPANHYALVEHGATLSAPPTERAE